MDISNLIDTWFLVKVLSLTLLGMYFIFALVVLKQVKLMTDTLQLGFEQFIKFLALAHLIFAVIVFLAAFVIL
ncbi:MAG: hypothetical protein UX13_C0016G0024 [Candidatus Woesebacteria bacterium GW2011_GWB1_45_5]|uniref:Uncharacterized protein n=1 Tax=Candidatus Woesebacteria bacterium GW2011_GWB1_45_5 TaxID=1618581 RepID=A0A0G1MQ78_9BACT|nr:MAG: hypothetical protein UX13_C0016G0024 [Candidatus Woesebacteria bacterium GW2011_GWB1_45_5]